MKKLLAIFIMVAMAFSFASCKNNNKDSSGVGDGDYGSLTGEVKFFLPGSAPDNMSDVTAEINSRLKASGRNYTVNFVFEGWGTYWSKAPLKGNEGYDACWMHANYISSYYAQKVLLDLTEYVDTYGDKIKETTPDMYFSTAKINGGLYAIPRVEPLSEINTPMMVRGDWMKEFGIDSIETLADLESYFAKAKTKLDSVSGAYVLDKDNGDFLKREYAKNYYFPLGSFSQYPVYIDLSEKVDGTYKVKNFYTSEAFKNMANKSREYYLAGYRNPNRQSLAADSIDSVFNSGLLAAIWSTATKVNERIDAFKTKNPDGEIVNILINPNDTKWITAGGNMISVYSRSKKAAHVVDFYNWILSDRANSDLVSYGISGKNYNLTSDGKLNMAGISDANNYQATFPSFVFNNFNNVRFSKEMSDAEIASTQNWDTEGDVRVSPLIGFIPEVTGTFSTAYSLVNAAEKNYSEDFLYGSKGLDQIQSGSTTYYQAFLNSLNQKLRYNGTQTAVIDIMIAELQAQVDEYVKANNL